MAKRKPKAGFIKKTGQMFQNHRRRARDCGQWLDYTLPELREEIVRCIRRGHCEYCQGHLDGDNYSGDHRVPICRGGKHKLSNLCFCCKRCNLAKGPLDYIEFRELMNIISRWPDELQQNTLARLRAGARSAKLPKLPMELAEKADDKNRLTKHEWCDPDAGPLQRYKKPIGPKKGKRKTKRAIEREERSNEPESRYEELQPGCRRDADGGWPASDPGDPAGGE